jgi:hypothetical protein
MNTDYLFLLDTLVLILLFLYLLQTNLIIHTLLIVETYRTLNFRYNEERKFKYKEEFK